MNTIKEQDWEIQFDEKFKLLHNITSWAMESCDCDLGETCSSQVKSFIRSNRSQLLQEIEERVREINTPWFPEDFENVNVFEEGKNYNWKTRQKGVNENIVDLLKLQKSDILTIINSFK